MIYWYTVVVVVVLVVVVVVAGGNGVDNGTIDGVNDRSSFPRDFGSTKTPRDFGIMIANAVTKQIRRSLTGSVAVDSRTVVPTGQTLTLHS